MSSHPEKYEQGKQDVKDTQKSAQSTWDKTKQGVQDATEYVKESAQSAWDTTKGVAHTAYEKTIGEPSERVAGQKDEIKGQVKDVSGDVKERAERAERAAREKN